MQIRAAQTPAPLDQLRSRATDRWRVICVAAVLLAALLLRVVILFAHQAVNSDEVAQQTMLALRGKYGASSFWSSQDNYFLKYPIYILARHLFGMDYPALVFEIVVFNLVLFASIVATYYLLVRYEALPRAPLGLLGVIAFWTISLGDPSRTLSHPNGRDPEFGVALLLIVAFGLFYQRRELSRLAPRAQMIVSGCFGIAAGAIIFDDPYFLYAIDGTFVIVALYYLLRARSWRHLLAERQYLLWIFLGVSGVVYVGIAKIALHFGLHVYSSSSLGITIVPFATLGTSIKGTLGGIVAIYDGFFFGLPINHDRAYQWLLNAALGSATVVLGLGLIRNWRRPERRNVHLLLPLTAVVVTGSFLLSSNSAQGPGNFRYFIIFLPIFALLFPAALMAVRDSESSLVLRRLLVAGLVVSSVWNTVAFITGIDAGPSHRSVVSTQIGIVHTLERLGLHKGYAPYWDANTTTYFSKGSAVTMPVNCIAGELTTFYWLMDSAWLDKPASRTYFIEDGIQAQIQPSDSVRMQCTAAQLAQQFGPPAKTVAIRPGLSIAVYDYDITSKLPPRATTQSP